MFKSLLLAAALVVAPVAQAANGFDTGTPDGLGSTLAIDGANWIAGQISFTNAVTITGVNAWLSDSNGTGGTFTVAVQESGATAAGVARITNAVSRAAYQQADVVLSGSSFVSGDVWTLSIKDQDNVSKTFTSTVFTSADAVAAEPGRLSPVRPCGCGVPAADRRLPGAGVRAGRHPPRHV